METIELTDANEVQNKNNTTTRLPEAPKRKKYGPILPFVIGVIVALIPWIVCLSLFIPIKGSYAYYYGYPSFFFLVGALVLLYFIIFHTKYEPNKYDIVKTCIVCVFVYSLACLLVFCINGTSMIKVSNNATRAG